MTNVYKRSPKQDKLLLAFLQAIVTLFGKKYRQKRKRLLALLNRGKFLEFNFDQSSFGTQFKKNNCQCAESS